MHKFYKNISVKKALMPLMAFCTLASSALKADAQVIQIGMTAGSFNGPAMPNPFPDAYEASRQQYLFLASELTAAGMLPGEITGVKFYIQFSGNTGLLENWEMRIGSTSATTLSNSSWETLGSSVTYTTTTMTPAGFSVPTPTPPTLQNWQGPDFPVGNRFMWNGVSNILIDICHGTPAALTTTTSSQSPTIYFRNTSFNSTHSSGQNNVAAGCGVTNLTTQGTQTQRPIIQFHTRPDCIRPDSISITNIKPYSADISWPATRLPSLSGARYDVRIDQTREHPANAPVTWDRVSRLTPNPGGPNVTNESDGTPFTAETQYFVHLRTACSNAPEPESDWILDSFYTIADCLPPVATIDQITSTTAVGSWLPVPTAYDYEYAVSVTKTPPTAGTRTTGTSVFLPGLSSSTYYSLFVRAYCSPTPTSRWTRVDFQSLKTTGVDDVAPDGFRINSYPNPVNEMLTIEVANAVGNATIEVADLTGKTVRTAVPQGEQTTIDMSGLAAGMYLVKYNDQQHSKTIKVTKQ